MRSIGPVLILGLATGSIYALTALGVVIVYKATGVLNFAHGAMGMVAAFLFSSLTRQAIPTLLAAPVALVFSAALGVAVAYGLRPLRRAPRLTRAIFMLGLLALLQNLATAIWGIRPRIVPSLFPSGGVKIIGFVLGYDQVGIIVITLGLVGGLSAFFRYTKLGVGIRAVSSDQDAAALQGINVTRITVVAWVLGSVLAGIAGILISTPAADAFSLTLLVIQAFAAALLGRLVSLPATFVGGIVLGLLTTVPASLEILRPHAQVIPPVVSFLLIVGILMLRSETSLIARGNEA
ncbi:MAG: branched-chain amino acid ABC transporter permease [Actinomycetota bacterium]